MEKRSAARELAYLALFQLPKNPEKLAKTDFHAICLSAIRTLSDYSKNNVKQADAFFIQVERKLMEYHINHEVNEGLDEASRGAPLPTTKEFFEELNKCYQGAALIRESLNVPELYWHYNDQQTQDFVFALVQNFVDKQEEVSNLLRDTSKSWDPNRMLKMDRIIIELACSEILGTDTPPKVIASEAIKLANKYSTEEGVKFVNGIIGDIIATVSH